MSKKLFTDTTSAVNVVLDVIESTPIKLTAVGLGSEKIEILDYCNPSSGGEPIGDGTVGNAYMESGNNPRTINVAGTYLISKPVTAVAATVFATHQRGQILTDVVSYSVL